MKLRKEEMREDDLLGYSCWIQLSDCFFFVIRELHDTKVSVTAVTRMELRK